MVRIKKLVVLLACIMMTTSYAGTPSLQLLQTWTTGALTTGSKDTLSIPDVFLAGDSIGIMINFNRDSLSGVVRYQYVTPQGNSNVEFADCDTLFTFTCVSGQMATFGGPIPVSAGNYGVYLYVVLENDDASTQTITSNIYQVIWR